MLVNDSNLSCCGRGFDSLRLHHFIFEITSAGEWRNWQTRRPVSTVLLQNLLHLELSVYLFIHL